MKNAKLMLLVMTVLMLLSCDRKPDLAYLDACAHPDALKEVKYYVKHKISDADGLKIAAEKNTNEKIVKELLKSKNIEEKEKYAALWISMDNKNIEVFEVLLKATKGENTYQSSTNTTILMRACEKDKTDIVKLLINAGSDVNAKEKNGMTPLMFACVNGNRQIINKLLEAGSDVNAKSNIGGDALSCAVEKGDKDLVNVLLKAGADANGKGFDGSTILMRACEFNDLDLVNLFIEKKADVNAQNKNGKTALMIACEKGNKDIVNVLLLAGADVNAKDNNSITPLSLAIEKKNSDIINSLIKAGADVNIKVSGEETPLIRACKEGDITLVNFLIKADADVNAKDKNGFTPLMVSSNKDIVNVLLAAGADVKIKTDGGFTALVQAYKIDNNEIKNILIKAGSNTKEVYEYYGIKMVRIPGKNYEMLSTEVTQKLYKFIMNKNPSKFKGDYLPVEQVSWYDAAAFCNALSRKFGLTSVYKINGYDVTQNDSANGFRLPTGAEWVYAAKGGANYTYSGSNKIDEVAWYSGNSSSKSHPVAQKKANGYGLYDMSGNVWEWSCDYIHGGSWYNPYADNFEVSGIGMVGADYRSHDVGFRVVRNIK